jgi:hypothetical protein
MLRTLKKHLRLEGHLSEYEVLGLLLGLQGGLLLPPRQLAVLLPLLLVSVQKDLSEQKKIFHNCRGKVTIECRCCRHIRCQLLLKAALL